MIDAGKGKKMWAARPILGQFLLVPSLGLPEWAIILFILLLLFGAGRVTTLGRDLGRAIREFRSGLQGQDQEEEKKPAEGKDREGS